MYRDCERGISRGCPLSPLLGALYLDVLDAAIEKLGLFYVRFMDEVLVLAPTRWALRRAVKCVNETLADLELEKHPDKTFIGRIEKGFDFLGYHFTRDGLRVASDTHKRFLERLSRLYEQERERPSGGSRLWDYARRWRRWAMGGLRPSPAPWIVTPRNTVTLQGACACAAMPQPPRLARPG